MAVWYSAFSIEFFDGVNICSSQPQQNLRARFGYRQLQVSYISLRWAGSRSQIQEDIIFLHLALSFEGSQIKRDSTHSILFVLVLEAATQSTGLLILSSEVLILLAVVFSLFSK